MTKKRRNNGRALSNRGRVKAISCTHCGRHVPKDKAVKRMTIKDIVDPSSKRDIRAKIFFNEFEIPKIYLKQMYCISCAIHMRVVRVRSAEDRKIREPPKRAARDASGNIIKTQKA